KRRGKMRGRGFVFNAETPRTQRKRREQRQKKADITLTMRRVAVKLRAPVKLRAHYVGEVIIAAAVGIDCPEHGADHTGVAGRLAEFVAGSGGGFAGNDI